MAATRWLNFFKDAGIPNGPASEYAIVFSDNRMRMDMLNELQKEILQDLGIKVMGDILAILRHSKKVYAEISRSAAEEFDVNRSKSSQQKNKAATGNMYSDLISKPASPPEKKSETAHPKKVSIDEKEVPPLKALPRRTSEKAQLKADKITNAVKSKGRSLSERFAEYDPVPVKKKKDNFNEIITICLPSDTEDNKEKVPSKDRKGHQQQEQRRTSSTKKTVFDRLGSDDKSSPIQEQSASISVPTQSLTRTTSASSTSSRKETKSGSSVFNRLGESVSNATQSKSNGISGRFGKMSSTSSKPGIASKSTLIVTRGEQSSIRLGLQSSDSVLRPIKSVKPLPRKPLAMDMEPTGKSKPLKSTPKQDTSGKLKVTMNKPQHERKSGPKSVFDRLGK